MLNHIPAGPLRHGLERATSLNTSDTVQRFSQQGLTAVKVTMGGVLNVVLVIALAVYLMLDGPHALQWLIASRAQR